MLAVFVWLAAVLQPSAGAVLQVTYHVAPGGDDGRDGSESAPWATLQHAAEQVQPGDTVLVHDGT